MDDPQPGCSKDPDYPYRGAAEPHRITQNTRTFSHHDYICSMDRPQHQQYSERGHTASYDNLFPTEYNKTQIAQLTQYIANADVVKALIDSQVSRTNDPTIIYNFIISEMGESFDTNCLYALIKSRLACYYQLMQPKELGVSEEVIYELIESLISITRDPSTIFQYIVSKLCIIEDPDLIRTMIDSRIEVYMEDRKSSSEFQPVDTFINPAYLPVTEVPSKPATIDLTDEEFSFALKLKEDYQRMGILSRKPTTQPIVQETQVTEVSHPTQVQELPLASEKSIEPIYSEESSETLEITYVCQDTEKTGSKTSPQEIAQVSQVPQVGEKLVKPVESSEERKISNIPKVVERPQIIGQAPENLVTLIENQERSETFKTPQVLDNDQDFSFCFNSCKLTEDPLDAESTCFQYDFIYYAIHMPNSQFFLFSKTRSSDVFIEFENFACYFYCCSQAMKDEFLRLFHFLFIHCYLLLLRFSPKCSNPRKAHEFYKKFITLLQFPNAGRANQLLQLKSVKDVRSHKYYKEYWKRKILVFFTDPAYDHLQQFFHEFKCRHLEYLYNQYFFVDDSILSTILSSYPLRDRQNDCPTWDLLAELGFKDTVIMKSCFKMKFNRKIHLKNIKSFDVNECLSNTCFTTGKPFIIISKQKRTCTYPHDSGNSSFMMLEEDILKAKVKGQHISVGNIIKFQNCVTLLKFVPGTHDYLLVSIENKVQLINLILRESLMTYVCNSKSFITDMDVDHVGDHFVTINGDGSINIFSYKNTNPLFHHKGSMQEKLIIVKFLRNEKYFATAIHSKEESSSIIRLWYIDVKLICVRKLWIKGVVNSLAFSTCGEHFATGDRLGYIRIWNTYTEDLIASFKGKEFFKGNLIPKKFHFRLCFSENNSFLAASLSQGLACVLHISGCGFKMNLPPLFAQKITTDTGNSIAWWNFIYLMLTVPKKRLQRRRKRQMAKEIIGKVKRKRKRDDAYTDYYLERKSMHYDRVSP